MNIIIIGDSLSMQRLKDNTKYEDTYGYLVKTSLDPKERNHVYILSKRANDSLTQSKPDNLLYNIKQFDPDIVIIHLGIVDCAPRLFTKNQQYIISILPEKLRSSIIAFISKRRLFFTKHFPKVYVKKGDFERHMQIIIDFIIANDAKPIIINVAKPDKRLISRSYNILQNVKDYNMVLLKLAEKNKCPLIDNYKMAEGIPGYLISGEVHLTKLGHKLLADEILKFIIK